MAQDTLTLKIQGEVSLADFTTTMQRFTEFVDALPLEIAKNIPVAWTVDELRAGSAVATIRGISPEPELVERTVL